MYLNLELAEVNAILTILGEVPTNRGVYPLLLKIKSQGENQDTVLPNEPIKKD